MVQLTKSNSARKQLAKNGFTFKQFFVGHDNCPMKITTDSVLLGAWVPISNVKHSVLDIGTGCGVIALMLAQRLDHHNINIDGIDISRDAITQFLLNIDSSPFNFVRAYLGDIAQYRLDSPHSYDLIVCNPPYFPIAVECRNKARQQARYTEQLDHRQLLMQVDRLLMDDGLFCLVLPYRLYDPFVATATETQMYLYKALHVRYSHHKEPSLALLAFKKSVTTNPDIHDFVMRNSDGSYTDEFAKLMQEFYLRF